MAILNNKKLMLVGLKGATGAKIVSTELIGQDENGGNIYKQTFDDGTTAKFVAPRGADGSGGGNIEEYYLVGTTAPTNETIADFVGQLYVDTTNNKTYQCTEINDGVYTWVMLIRETDFASNTKGGVVKVSTSLAYGLEILNAPTNQQAHGCLTLKPPNDNKIKNRLKNSYSREPVTLQWADKVVIAVLTDPQVMMTTEQQEKAQAWLGIKSQQEAEQKWYPVNCQGNGAIGGQPLFVSSAVLTKLPTKVKINTLAVFGSNGPPIVAYNQEIETVVDYVNNGFTIKRVHFTEDLATGETVDEYMDFTFWVRSMLDIHNELYTGISAGPTDLYTVDIELFI